MIPEQLAINHLTYQTSPILPADFRRGKRAVSTPKPAATGGRWQTTNNTPIRDYNCTDFQTQAESQRVLDSTPGEYPHNLDKDGDRIACESLR